MCLSPQILSKYTKQAITSSFDVEPDAVISGKVGFGLRSSVLHGEFPEHVLCVEHADAGAVVWSVLGTVGGFRDLHATVEHDT